jgi:hypothetical protein
MRPRLLLRVGETAQLAEGQLPEDINEYIGEILFERHQMKLTEMEHKNRVLR